MSTEFYLNNDKATSGQLKRIAFRFYSGIQNGKTIQFGFDAQLLNYVRSVELISENREVLTIAELHESADTVEFRNGLDYDGSTSSFGLAQDKPK